MNFQGSPHFGGGGGIHQTQEMLVDPSMLGQVGTPEGFHEGPVYTSTVPDEMDYRPVHVRQASMDHMPVTAVCFDSQEMLWAGSQRGYVSSFYGMQFHKHTAFRASLEGDTQPEVRQILTMDNGVLSLSSTRLRLNMRRSQPIYSYTDSDMQQMQCMIEKGPDTILMGGHQKKVIEFNAHKGQVVNKYEVGEAGCAVFRQAGKYLCAGDITGKVTLYDANTMRREHVLDAHSSMLSDFDVQRNLLVTCGLSTRMDNHLVADRLLMVYDMRVMRAMAPIQVDIDPTFLRFVPSLSHHLVVVSQFGRFQLTDSTSVSQSMMIYPVNTNGQAITSFDLSKTCQAMAFGDASGYVHLFANNEHAVFSGLDIPTEFADHSDPPHHEMHMMDELSFFSKIPTFYPQNDSMLSEWPDSMMKKIHRKPKPIDPEILRSMKVVHNVCCVPNPKKGRLNQAPYNLSKENGTKRQLSVPESPIGRGDDPFKTVPKEYQRMWMRYTKLDDFDFLHYNKTHFSGLTAEYNNSYCNGLLQVLYFVEPLRAALLSHICQREFCLACELGFLFHMLDTKKGEACQAKNFLRAFRTLTEAAALGLLLTETEEINGSSNLLTLIPRWQRFVIQQINSETCMQVEVFPDSSPVETGTSAAAQTPAPQEAVPEKKAESGGGKGRKKKNKRGKKKEENKAEQVEKEGEEGSGEDSLRTTQDEQPEETPRFEEVSIVKDLFFINTKSELVCRCGTESSKDEHSKIIVLNYPSNSSSDPERKVKFSEVVRHSLTSDSTMQAYCNDCRKYQLHTKRRKVTSLPDVLAFDCNLSNESNLNFWKQQLQILLKEKKETESSANNENSPPRPKTMCRYGSSCRRADCKYFHNKDSYSDKDRAGETMGDAGDASGEQFNPSWIPMGLRIKRQNDGDVTVDEVSDEEPLPKDEAEQRELYEVYSVVYVIEQQDAGRHLVSCIKVSEPFHQRKEQVTCTQWYLFNDFCLQPIERPENVSVNLAWKIPSVVYYTRRTYLKSYDSTVNSWCQFDILYNDPALANPKRHKMTFIPLQPSETLSKGDLVGLDAEFISLKEEEAELRSDGTKSTIKPSHVSPGRVTCIRGLGDHFGEPFIDDYILTPEQVSDYLTEFSGIQPGELDPMTSTKHLTTLKSTYQKLRCLLDIGVAFVGHGLKKDFKVINLQVPKEQIVDTVQLFHMPNKRFISLRFLAWFFLGKNIQSGQHDSAEDARIALLLYKRYQQLQAEGPDTVQATINELYETGRQQAWKVPAAPINQAPGWPPMDPGDPSFLWTGHGGHDSEEDILDQTPAFYET